MYGYIHLPWVGKDDIYAVAVGWGVIIPMVTIFCYLSDILLPSLYWHFSVMAMLNSAMLGSSVVVYSLDMKPMKPNDQGRQL